MPTLEYDFASESAMEAAVAGLPLYVVPDWHMTRVMGYPTYKITGSLEALAALDARVFPA